MMLVILKIYGHEHHWESNESINSLEDNVCTLNFRGLRDLLKPMSSDYETCIGLCILKAQCNWCMDNSFWLFV